jgi:hypothetical protein
LLTPQEIEALKEEIRAEQKGGQMLDSILDNPEFQSRRIQKEIEEESR